MSIKEMLEKANKESFEHKLPFVLDKLSDLIKERVASISRVELAKMMCENIEQSSLCFFKGKKDLEKMNFFLWEDNFKRQCFHTPD
jgi:hypothetical protein